ncbi:hypothetical protein AB0H29_22155, partial [Streptomyces thermolilacinus]
RETGLSTYLALTFGTLLSSQGTDASFVLTLSSLRAFLRALPFGVSNLTRSFSRSVSGSDFVSGGRWRAFAFRLDSDFIRFISAD